MKRERKASMRRASIQDSTFPVRLADAEHQPLVVEPERAQAVALSPLHYKRPHSYTLYDHGDKTIRYKNVSVSGL